LRRFLSTDAALSSSQLLPTTFARTRRRLPMCYNTELPEKTPDLIDESDAIILRSTRILAALVGAMASNGRCRRWRNPALRLDVKPCSRPLSRFSGKRAARTVLARPPRSFRPADRRIEALHGVGSTGRWRCWSPRAASLFPTGRRPSCKSFARAPRRERFALHSARSIFIWDRFEAARRRDRQSPAPPSHPGGRCFSDR
jgi:hypothetical protein